MIEIIDAHTHFGKDNFWPNEGMYTEYCKNSKYVSEIFGMSVPCPIILKEDGTKTILSYYELDNKEFKHYQVETKEGVINKTLQKKDQNPYKEANDYIYNLSLKENKIRINYVPIIHPYFYSIDDFTEHIKKGAQIFKIHGVACGVNPQKIDSHFFETIEALNIPLIIHTDYSDDENILSYNNALNWLKRLEPYNIKVFFTHALRLVENGADIINKDNRYIIGIGPDRILNTKGQTSHYTNDYLKYCFSRYDIDKIVFDIDYPWNVININNLNYDWESVNRIEQLGLDFNEKEKIFHKNIKKFIRKR